MEVEVVLVESLWLLLLECQELVASGQWGSGIPVSHGMGKEVEEVVVLGGIPSTSASAEYLWHVRLMPRLLAVLFWGWAVG